MLSEGQVNPGIRVGIWFAATLFLLCSLCVLYGYLSNMSTAMDAYGTHVDHESSVNIDGAVDGVLYVRLLTPKPETYYGSVISDATLAVVDEDGYPVASAVSIPADGEFHVVGQYEANWRSIFLIKSMVYESGLMFDVGLLRYGVSPVFLNLHDGIWHVYSLPRSTLKLTEKSAVRDGEPCFVTINLDGIPTVMLTKSNLSDWITASIDQSQTTINTYSKEALRFDFEKAHLKRNIKRSYACNQLLEHLDTLESGDLMALQEVYSEYRLTEASAQAPFLVPDPYLTP